MCSTSSSCEAAPLALGFVLGRLLEEKLRQALIVSDGSPLTFVTSPLSLGLLLVAAAALALAVLPSIRKSRDEVSKTPDIDIGTRQSRVPTSPPTYVMPASRPAGGLALP